MNAGAGCIVPSLKFKVESWRWKSRPQVELVQGNGFRVHDLCELGSFNTMFAEETKRGSQRPFLTTTQ